MTDLRITYVCAHCGQLAEVPFFSVEVFDSGTALKCDKCGENTVFDLSTFSQRAVKEHRVRMLEENVRWFGDFCSRAMELLDEAGIPGEAESVPIMERLGMMSSRLRKCGALEEAIEQALPFVREMECYLDGELGHWAHKVLRILEAEIE